MTHLIPKDGRSETCLREPGAILAGAVRLDFDHPAASPFLVHLDHRPFVGTEAACVLEVHQPHPRGTDWATLEFALDALPRNAFVSFDARLLPNMPVVLKIYARDVERDVAVLPLNHRVNHFRVPINPDLADGTSREQDLRVAFTLPRRSWFIFQIANLSVGREAAMTAA